VIRVNRDQISRLGTGKLTGKEQERAGKGTGRRSFKMGDVAAEEFAFKDRPRFSIDNASAGGYVTWKRSAVSCLRSSKAWHDSLLPSQVDLAGHKRRESLNAGMYRRQHGVPQSKSDHKKCCLCKHGCEPSRCSV